MPSIRRDWRDRPSLIHRNTRTTWWMRDGRIITPGQFFGQLIHIPRITLISDPFSDEHPVRLHRQQFPVRLGYAVTFSKSVGQTLQRAGIYLASPCWSHGVLYGALSRVGHPDAIRLAFRQRSTGRRQGVSDIDSKTFFTRSPTFREVFNHIPLQDPSHPQQHHKSFNISASHADTCPPPPHINHTIIHENYDDDDFADNLPPRPNDFCSICAGPINTLFPAASFLNPCHCIRPTFHPRCYEEFRHEFKADFNCPICHAHNLPSQLIHDDSSLIHQPTHISPQNDTTTQNTQHNHDAEQHRLSPATRQCAICTAHVSVLDQARFIPSTICQCQPPVRLHYQCVVDHCPLNPSATLERLYQCSHCGTISAIDLTRRPLNTIRVSHTHTRLHTFAHSHNHHHNSNATPHSQQLIPQLHAALNDPNGRTSWLFVPIIHAVLQTIDPHIQTFMVSLFTQPVWDHLIHTFTQDFILRYGTIHEARQQISPFFQQRGYIDAPVQESLLFPFDDIHLLQVIVFLARQSPQPLDVAQFQSHFVHTLQQDPHIQHYLHQQQ